MAYPEGLEPSTYGFGGRCVAITPEIHFTYTLSHYTLVPAVEAFTTWAFADGRVQFSLEYWEPGCGFVGETTYDGEYLDTNDVDSRADPEEYKRIASEVWGYEEWDEPEPLTEWYKSGVEDKGLT